MQLGGSYDGTTLTTFNQAWNDMVKGTIFQGKDWNLDKLKTTEDGLPARAVGYTSESLKTQIDTWKGEAATFGAPMSDERLAIAANLKKGADATYSLNDCINAIVCYCIQVKTGVDGAITDVHLGDFCAAYDFDLKVPTGQTFANTLIKDPAAGFSNPLRILVFMMQFKFPDDAYSAAQLGDELTAAKTIYGQLQGEGKTFDTDLFEQAAVKVAGGTDANVKAWAKVIKHCSLRGISKGDAAAQVGAAQAEAAYTDAGKPLDEQLAAAPVIDNQLYWLVVAMSFELSDLNSDQGKANAIKGLGGADSYTAA